MNILFSQSLQELTTLAVGHWFASTRAVILALCKIPVKFFIISLTQLRIRLLPVPGVEVTDETVKLPPYISAVLSFAVARFGTMVETMLFRAPGDCAILVQILSAPCRERVYPFRLLVAFWRFSYTFIAASRPETADETVKLSRYVSALPDFAASHSRSEHCSPVCNGLAGTHRSGYRKNRIGTP